MEYSVRRKGRLTLAAQTHQVFRRGHPLQIPDPTSPPPGYQTIVVMLANQVWEVVKSLVRCLLLYDYSS